jgi:hypothetical protein
MTDVSIVSTGGKNTIPVRTFLTQANAGLVEGDVVKIGGTGNNFAVKIANGNPEVATDRVLGIVKEASTDTASAAGTVEVYLIDSRTVLRAKASNAANLANGILNDSVTFDVSGGGVITIDEDEGDDPDVHGCIILGFNEAEGTVDFIIKNGALIDGLV